MKKALKISVSTLLFALALLVTQIPAQPVAADEDSVSTDADFQLNGTILVKYTGTAKTVSVPASVTQIGEEAFADHAEMETLEFAGENVESIAYRAFTGCNGLTEVTLPDSVVEIGSGAFSNCIGLKTVEFGTGIKELGLGSFAGCVELEELNVPEENETFLMDEEDGCLYDAEKTKLYLMLPVREEELYKMPDTITDIAEYAFWGCNTITGVQLSSHLKQIPDFSFSNCKALTGITIPYSVSLISLKAFENCVNLENVVIPASVSNIHPTAFDGCPKLKIAAEQGTVAYKFYQQWKEKNQAEYEDTGNSGDVSDGDAEEKPDAEDTLEGTLLGSTSIVGNRAVVFIEHEKNSDGELVSGGDGNVVNGTGDGTEANGSTVKGRDIPKFTFAFDRILADQAFYKSQDMTGYQFPEGVTEIGEFTFARSNLVAADIPKGVTQIGYGAFYHCDYLREVKIPSSVTYIAPKAFANTMWLENWMTGSGSENYLIVGNGILLAYRGNEQHLQLPDTVKRIAPEAFAGNVDILSVTLPDSVIEIGEDAFLNCRNLKTVSGGANVKIIRDRAFKGCSLSSAHVWDKVEYLGLECFDFSEAALSASNKVVVFDNKEKLPTASYEPAAERLSNEDARGYVLGDTQFAIVDKKIKPDMLANTVLSAEEYGFKGIVAYISSKDKGIVTCIATTYTEEEFKTAYIPEYITIDGKNYQVTGADAVTVFGFDKKGTVGSIEIVNESEKLSDVSAELEGNTGTYYLKLTDSKDAYDALNAGYEAVYRQALPTNGVYADIRLVEQNSGVPITKLGSQKLRVTMTLPKNIVDGSLRIFTVDRNGQIENIAYTRTGNTVTMYVSHLSYFGFCNTGGGQVNNGQLDASPDTGDYLQPKWFLALGFASMGIAVLFIKKKRA